MKKVMFGTLFCTLFFASFSYAGNFGFGPSFVLRYDSFHGYVDGGGLQIMYQFTPRLEANISAIYTEWSSGRERPAPAYDFETRYEKTSLFFSLRLYLPYQNSSVLPYTFILLGIDKELNVYNHTTYELESFGVESSITYPEEKSQNRVTGGGLGFQFPIGKYIYYDMNIGYYSQYTNLSMGFNIRF